MLRQRPDDPAYLNLLAACLGLLGEDERVGEIYQRLATDYPKQPRIWLNYGHALRTAGKSGDALAEPQDAPIANRRETVGVAEEPLQLADREFGAAGGVAHGLAGAQGR